MSDGLLEDPLVRWWSHSKLHLVRGCFHWIPHFRLGISATAPPHLPWSSQFQRPVGWGNSSVWGLRALIKSHQRQHDHLRCVSWAECLTRNGWHQHEASNMGGLLLDLPHQKGPKEGINIEFSIQSFGHCYLTWMSLNICIGSNSCTRFHHGSTNLEETECLTLSDIMWHHVYHQYMGLSENSTPQTVKVYQ